VDEQPLRQDAADDLDSIARRIDIDAPIGRVWELVKRPGWWINQGTIEEAPDLREEGELTVVTHPVHGEFAVATVALTPPRYAAFRSYDNRVPAPSEESTLVEFWIEERSGGGVTLDVRESGFSRLAEGPDQWRQRESNVKGWAIELDAAKRHLEGTDGVRVVPAKPDS
jgi:uncharacterized protein YndB with AHSA1/START domain